MPTLSSNSLQQRDTSSQKRHVTQLGPREVQGHSKSIQLHSIKLVWGRPYVKQFQATTDLE